MLSKEELLIQRYKVIGPYPGSRFEIGDILIRYNLNASDTRVYTYTTNPSSPLQGISARKEDVETMPNIFQPLPWWSDREPEDMPEYLECPSRKMFFRVERWHKSYFIIDGKQKMQYGNYIPATRAEYEAFNQKP
jgi:hypothetical protein